MREKTNQLPRLLHSDAAPERRERIYLFVVTALAVFFIVLLVTARPHPDSSVEAVLVRTAGDAAEPPRFVVEGPGGLLAEGAVAQALEQVRGTSASDALVAHFQDQLQVVEKVGATPDTRTLHLRYDGGLPEGAAVVNQLTEMHLAQASAAAVEMSRVRRAKAATQLSHAQRQFETATQQAEKFLREQWSQMQQSAVMQGSAVGGDFEFLTHLASQRPQQSRQAQLNERRDALQKQMDEMLVRFNREHPQVQNLQLELNLIDVELQSFAEQTPSASPVFRQAITKTLSAVDRQKIAHFRTQRAHYNQLLDRQRRAEEQLAVAQVAYAQAQQAERSALASQIKIERLAEPPRTSRAVEWSMAAFAAMLAIACGGFAASGVPHDPTFRSRAQAEHWLDAPVAGCVADPTVKVHPNQGRWPIVLQFARRASEVGLLAVVLLLGAMILRDAHFAVQLATDPLAALTDAGRQLSVWLQ